MSYWPVVDPEVASLASVWESQAGVRRVHRIADPDGLPMWLDDIRAEVAVILPAERPGRGTEGAPEERGATEACPPGFPSVAVLREVRQKHPGVVLIACCPEGAARHAGDYLLAGCDELLEAPLEDAILNGAALTAVQRGLARRSAALKTTVEQVELTEARLQSHVSNWLVDRHNEHSHELATPLTPALMDLHGLLKRRDHLDAAGQTLLDRLSRNLERLGDAVRAIKAESQALALQGDRAHLATRADAPRRAPDAGSIAAQEAAQEDARRGPTEGSEGSIHPPRQNAK